MWKSQTSKDFGDGIRAVVTQNDKDEFSWSVTRCDQRFMNGVSTSMESALERCEACVAVMQSPSPTLPEGWQESGPRCWVRPGTPQIGVTQYVDRTVTALQLHFDVVLAGTDPQKGIAAADAVQSKWESSVREKVLVALAQAAQLHGFGRVEHE